MTIFATSNHECGTRNNESRYKSGIFCATKQRGY